MIKGLGLLSSIRGGNFRFCTNGRLDKVMEIVEDMVRSGHFPDKMMFATIMDAHFKAGKLKAASNVYKELSARGFEPDIVSLSTLMDGLSKHGHLQEA